MFDLLQELCEADGTSGREKPIRERIIAHLGGHPYTVDPMGNLIVEVKGEQRAAHRVMLSAHMDEVGVIASYINADGTVRFMNVGGIRVSALLGKAVRFENGVTGVIGIRPVHLCTPEEKELLPEADSLFIDIGASSKEEAEKRIAVGDTAVFTSEYTLMGDRILSKAIDDRVGCAALLDMIRQGMKYGTVFCFVTEEEVGLRGAMTAAFTAAPEYAIVLEATTAADIPGTREDQRVCELGKGAAVGFMDNATVYDPELFRKAFAVAKENGIRIQPKTMVAGGNDAGSIHKSRGGVKTLTINVPCRYIHSASCVCDKNDVEAFRSLAEKCAECFADG